MKEQLNNFPKRIKIKPEWLGSWEDPEDYQWAYLCISVTRDLKFRVSYDIYNPYEGGVTGRLPSPEGSNPEPWSPGLDGGYTGDDIEVLVENMGEWLVSERLL